MEITPIGFVRNARHDVQETDHWHDVRSLIQIDERFGDRCLQGLSDFSHVDVVYHFDKFDERLDHTQPRRPRGRSDLPEVGVFADRGPRRPNRIGVTTCRILHADRRELEVMGLDAVDGTPILDLKPTMTHFIPESIRQPTWVDSLMGEYFR